MSDVAVSLQTCEARIEAAVQRTLAKLDSSVKELFPDAIADFGTTKRHESYVFSYRRYSSSLNSSIDPVVVGVNCQYCIGGILISGDITGEENGDVVYCAKQRVISDDLNVEDLEAAVQATASDLCTRAGDVARALRDESRGI